MQLDLLSLEPQVVISLSDTARSRQPLPRENSSLLHTTSNSSTSSKHMVETTRRLNSELRSRFAAVRDACSELKDTHLHDVTTALLKEYATQIHDLMEECETLVSSLPERVAEMAAADAKGSFAHVASKMMRQSIMRRASQVPSSRAVVVPSAPPTPRASIGPGCPRVPTNLLPDTPGRPSSTLVQPTEAASEKMMNLARGLYLALESASRALGAEKALLCVPNRGVKDDLRVVAYYGFDATAPEHRNKDGKSIEFACFQSKFLVNCTSGTNPPYEIDYDGVLRYFEDALTESQANAPDDNVLNSGGLAGGISLSSSAKFVALHAGGGGRKSSYWSKLYCPVRRDTSSPPLGVIAFLQKERGSSNFSSDDEHLAFGTATVVAAMLQRCADFELLSRCSDHIATSLPPLTVPSNSITNSLTPGCRSQLVYRTNGGEGPKDIKILVGDSTTAERLDGHTPLLHIAQYITRLQDSWRNAVLLNSQLSKTHEDRTRVVTALLARARVSEFRNEALMTERVAAIPLSRKPLFEKPKPQRSAKGDEAQQKGSQPAAPSGNATPTAQDPIEFSQSAHPPDADADSSSQVSSGDPNDDDVYSVDRNETPSSEGSADGNEDGDEEEEESQPAMSTSDRAKMLLFGVQAGAAPALKRRNSSLIAESPNGDGEASS